MNHFILVLFVSRCFCSVIWVTLMAWIALRTLFGTAFPEAAEIVRILVFGGLFDTFSIQEVNIMDLSCS